MAKPRFIALFLTISLAWVGAVGSIAAADGPQSVDTAGRPPYQPAPELRDFLKGLNQVGNPLDSMTAESAPGLWLREVVDARKVLESIPVESIRDLCVPARNHQIPIRIYTPRDKKLARSGKLPILVYLHGGGWTLGSIASYDSITRALADEIPALVISVDYRLAPEHPFPAGTEDAYLAMEWVARNAEEIGGDPARIAVAGDSGGGNLATVTARKAKRAGISIVFQALFFPSTDISRTDSPSYDQYGQGYLLTKKSVESFRKFYLPNPHDWTNPDASPLRASNDDLAVLPPTLIIVAGCDPLREEGIAYARKLRDNGVPVTCRTEEEMIHGFLSFYNSALTPALSHRVEPILQHAADAIREAFTTSN